MTGTLAARTMRGIGIAAFMGFLAASYADAARLSDAQVKQAIISESLSSYPGTCPSPYNTDRDRPFSASNVG
jgi:hypothetical protein